MNLVVDAPNPRSFKAAREQRKLDVIEVATYTGISSSRLEDFENGVRQPSLKQVEMLSKLYNIPIYLLYLDVTPNLENILPDFRRVNPAPADLSPRGLARIWSTEHISSFAKQLTGALAKNLPEFNNLPVKTSLSARFATSFREEFDHWLTVRQDKFNFSGAREAQFLAGLRLYFESHKKISLINDAPASDYFGFYNEPSIGLDSIFVNRQISSKKAQLFTFMHELGHSLLKEEGVSDPFSPKNKVERICNKFAAEFLAPENEFLELASSAGRTTKSSTNGFIQWVSNRCLLSRQATAVRLAELSLITDIEYKSWRKKQLVFAALEKEEEKESLGTGGPGAFAKQVGELGCLSVYLAGEAVNRRLVDSLDVQRGLGLSESVQEKSFALAKKRLEAALN